MAVRDVKTYKQIIVDFLERKKEATLQEIYGEVKKKRQNLSLHWDAIVRNQLYYSHTFVKVKDKWKLK